MGVRARHGFTLIELLVVISIIGLLASILMISLGHARTKAKTSRAQQDLMQIMKAIELARDDQNKNLKDITGNNCSDCGCRSAGDLRNIPNTAPCASTMNTQFAKLGFVKAPRDPWGSPYLMDENEGEGGCDTTRKDHIYSAGPDGIDGAESWTDEVLLLIPHFACP